MCQSQTNTVWYHLYVESKHYNKLVNVTQIEKRNRGSKWGKELVKQYRAVEMGVANYSV